MNEPGTEKPDEKPVAQSVVPRWRQVASNAWAQGALVGVLTLCAMLFYQFVPGVVQTADGAALHATSVGLPDVDSYYHAKMGYLYRTGEVQAAGAEFHWTRESLWGREFSDKDYLFHVYLVPFTLLADGPGDAEGLVLAAKLGTSVLGILLVLTLFAVMRAFGVRHPWLFALALAAVGGSYIIFRYNMCRSYLMAISFALVGWLLLARGKRLALFLVAVAYTLSYTASHLLLALALVRLLGALLTGPAEGGTRMAELRGNLILLACVAAGIAAGCALHPQPLELMKLWWVQNVLVLALSHRESLAVVGEGISKAFGFAVNLQPEIELSLGRELAPPTGAEVLFGNPLLLVAPMVLPLAAALLRWRPSRETILTSGAALALLMAYLVSSRFIEYATPFTVVAIGLWVTGLLESDGYRQWQQRRPVWSRALPLSAAAIALIATVALWVGTSLAYRVQKGEGIEAAGRWLHENPSAHGSVVWHDRWDDFPALMFYASECDYLVGLDPTFFYVQDTERYRDWIEIKRGKRRDFLDDIRDKFGARYILAHRGTSEFFYNRLHEYALQGRLELCVREQGDSWSLYRIVR